MAKPKDYTGMRNGKLVAIYYVGRSDKYRGRIWQFHCDCGNIVEQIAAMVFGCDIQSCGCKTVEHCRALVAAGHHYQKGHKPQMKGRWRTQLRDERGYFIKAQTFKRVIRFGD